MDDAKKVINTILVELFNDILAIEGNALRSGEFENITMIEFHVLEAIAPGSGKTMSETARKLGVTIGTLTTTVNRLIRKGVVERAKIEEDRRIVMVRLTPKGLRAYRHHEAFHQEMLESLSASLSPQDNEVLITALRDIQSFFAAKARQYQKKDPASS